MLSIWNHPKFCHLEKTSTEIFCEIDRKHCQRGENAGFFLFPKCVQKTLFFRVVKSRDCLVKSYYIYHSSTQEKHFENIVGKGEDADNQHFLLLLQWFLPFPMVSLGYSLFLSSANAFNLDKLKKLLLGKELMTSSRSLPTNTPTNTDVPL